MLFFFLIYAVSLQCGRSRDRPKKGKQTHQKRVCGSKYFRRWWRNAKSHENKRTALPSAHRDFFFGKLCWMKTKIRFGSREAAHSILQNSVFLPPLPSFQCKGLLACGRSWNHNPLWASAWWIRSAVHRSSLSWSAECWATRMWSKIHKSQLTAADKDSFLPSFCGRKVTDCEWIIELSVKERSWAEHKLTHSMLQPLLASFQPYSGS